MMTRWLGALALASFCALIFAMQLDFPRIVRVEGYTTAQGGVARLHTATAGVLTQLWVRDGQAVEAGQVLARVSSERYSGVGALDAQQAALAEQKKTLALTSLALTTEAQAAQRKQVLDRIRSLQLEIAQIEEEQTLAKARLKEVEKNALNYAQLVAEGFVSEEGARQKRLEHIDQKIQTSSLSRSRLTLERELGSQFDSLRLLALQGASERSAMQKEVANLTQELNEHSGKKLELVAPIAGRVTQIAASAGQVVTPEIPLLSIVPKGQLMEVVLLIPSRSIGFVRLAQKVSVRYQAYPFEHYGRHAGTITEIAKAALAPRDVVQHIQVTEPVYTVRVALPTPYLLSGQTRLAITPGMVVEADVELDRLKVYQWLLEPLYKLGGRV